MLLALYIILSFYTALAETRPLSEGESFAFNAVFGTSDMKKLLEIEKNPAAYWEEREKALQDEAVTHIEFCKRYTQEAKAFIKAEALKTNYQPWFVCDPNGLEEVIKADIPESHPAYPTAVALFTAIACDHMCDPTRESTQFLLSFENLCIKIANFKADNDISHELNQRQRWVIRDKAECSLFDSLIMLSNQEYLCAAAPLHQRMDYRAHRRNGAYLFWGYHGSIRRDSVNHAFKQHLLERCLRKHGVSSCDYFRRCWNKKGLIKNDIFALAEQSLGCYYNSHELPSVNGAWSAGDLESLIFPRTESLTDDGFLPIVPYFAMPRHPNFDWKTTELQPRAMDDAQTHGALLYLRSKYCRLHGEAMLNPETRNSWSCTLF